MDFNLQNSVHTLEYDMIDYGDNNPMGYRNGDDNVFRFRTTVNF